MVAWVEENRGFVEYESQMDSGGNYRPTFVLLGPRWLRHGIGEDYFQAVVGVTFMKSPVVDLAPLAKLSRLEHLDLNGTSKTDFTTLGNLKQLTILRLNDTQIDDLAPLASLTHLEDISLARTRVTDLAPLAKLPALKFLNLSGTPVTDLAPLASIPSLQSSVPFRSDGCRDDQVWELQRALPNCQIIR